MLGGDDQVDIEFVSALTVNGGAGDDRISIDLEAASALALSGGSGNDTILNTLASDVTMVGGSGDDRLYYGTLMIGGSGDDFLHCRSGAVTSGGSGADTLVLNRGWDSNPPPIDTVISVVVRDFESGVDKIDFRDIFDLYDRYTGPISPSFIGNDRFDGTLGQVRAAQTKFGVTRVEVDADGDAAADVVIVIRNGEVVEAGDFVLT